MRVAFGGSMGYGMTLGPTERAEIPDPQLATYMAVGKVPS